jgi:hypothetical protein
MSNLGFMQGDQGKNSFYLEDTLLHATGSRKINRKRPPAKQQAYSHRTTKETTRPRIHPFGSVKSAITPTSLCLKHLSQSLSV